MGTEADLVDLLEQAYSTTAETFQTISAHQFEWSSPCADWSVRQVGNHLIETLDFFGRVVNEQPSAELTGEDTNEIEGDPAVAFRGAAQQCLTGFQRHGALEQVFPFPFGPTPGLVIAKIGLSETLIHGWDMARGAGLPYAPDDAVVEAVTQFQSHGDENDLRKDGMFGPPRPTDPHAPPFAALLGFLGRES